MLRGNWRAAIFIVALIISVPVSALAAGPDDILGVWNTEGNEAKIDIYKCGTKYCGKIIWLSEPVYPADSKDGAAGAPVLDHNNPDTELKKTPLIGLPILLDFVFEGDDTWTGGRIYNSDNGKTYSARLTLVSPNKLKVRAFIGIPLIGGSTTWTR